jgi:hypothetical protein
VGDPDDSSRVVDGWARLTRDQQFERAVRITMKASALLLEALAPEDRAQYARQMGWSEDRMRANIRRLLEEQDVVPAEWVAGIKAGWAASVADQIEDF